MVAAAWLVDAGVLVVVGGLLVVGAGALEVVTGNLVVVAGTVDCSSVVGFLVVAL